MEAESQPEDSRPRAEERLVDIGVTRPMMEEDHPPQLFSNEDDSPTLEEVTETTQLVPRENFQPSLSYATRKTIALGALDVALLMANTSQLTALLVAPDNKKAVFFILIIILITISMLLQIVLGIVLLILGFSNPRTTAAVNRTVQLNNLSVCITLVITIFNVFITAFGVTYVENDEP